ncbi:hypothetical protein CEY16_01025 [Halalkalibacillus sediminis]|uniref:Flavin reductase like domain-containing protein n=1 Tax=Halalkalibacillus sediminis TaxID=2018042 RepID=A0A2I0QW89_9BACI|nr:flavin reductase family protein [Halalkalibacillus sediminis]PKR78370.1 hypothetical protein CEY16_01025 [Halalkalibacillus sediminis]
MISINAASLNKKENYKLLSGSVIPRPIAFVTSMDSEGTLNAAPFSFFNVVSAEPPMIAFSVGRVDGKMAKHTSRNILKNKEFVVHIVDETILHEMNQTAAPYEDGISEVDKVNLTSIDSEKVTVPSLKEPKIRMECRLSQSIPLGKDGVYSNDLLIGEVLCYHFDEAVYEDGKIIAEALNPVARLAGPNYANLGNYQTIARPTDTK